MPRRILTGYFLCDRLWKHITGLLKVQASMVFAIVRVIKWGRQRNVLIVRIGNGASRPINVPTGDMKRLYKGPPLLKNSSVPVPAAPSAKRETMPGIWGGEAAGLSEWGQ
jgi:hypothetical protein